MKEFLNDNVKSISFDIDGTLYPIFKVQLRWWIFFFIKPFCAIRFILIKRTWEKRRRGNLSIQILSDDIIFFEDFLSTCLISEKDIFPQIKEILEICKNKSIKIYFLSDHGAEKKINKLKLCEFGTPINCLTETGELKPHLKISQLLSNQYKIDPKSHLHLGDRWTDEEQAKIFGCEFVYFPKKINSINKLNFSFK